MLIYQRASLAAELARKIATNGNPVPSALRNIA